MKHYDLVIIGAGLIGKSLAFALQNFGLKIALIEKSNSQQAESFFQYRPLSLSHTSIEFFKSIGIWQHISDTATVIKNIHISEKGCFGSVYLQASEYGMAGFGAVIDATVLEKVLSEKLLTQNSDYYQGIIPSHFEKFPEYWQIHLGEFSIQGKLLIGADGVESSLRQLENIKGNGHMNEQFALIASLSLQSSFVNVAYERFTKEGSLAILPCQKNKVKSIWIASKKNIDILNQQNNQQLLNSLQKTIGYRVGKLTAIDYRFIHPIQVAMSEKIYGHRFVLIGNAANTLHPIAAQGFNLGIRDVRELITILKDRSQIKDIGSEHMLKKFAKARQQDHKSFNFITRSLLKLFDLQVFPMQNLRSYGLFLCDIMPSAKRWIAYKGMGLQEKFTSLSDEDF